MKEYHKSEQVKPAPDPQPDYEAQQAARDAVMEIPLFPDLPVALKNALGYGPHVDMLQHFVYWFHPSKPKMQRRWTLYKTYKEWHSECGLSDRQVKKGRKILRDLGLAAEKKGPHGRVHYRVDWVALAKALGLDAITDQSDDIDEWFDDEIDEISLDGTTDQGQIGRHGDQGSLDGITDRPNTGDYAGDYFQENPTLQVAAEPAFAEPAAHEINGKKEQKQVVDQPGGDKRHSQDGDTPGEKKAARLKVVEEPVAPPKPDDGALLADVREILNPDTGRWWGAKHISERHSPEKVAQFLAGEDELPYDGRAEELEPVVRYVMWGAA